MKQLIIELEFTRSAMGATARTAVENRRTNYGVAKYQPTKASCDTQLAVQKLMSSVVEATILTISFKDDALIS